MTKRPDYEAQYVTHSVAPCLRCGRHEWVDFYLYDGKFSPHKAELIASRGGWHHPIRDRIEAGENVLRYVCECIHCGVVVS